MTDLLCGEPTLHDTRIRQRLCADFACLQLHPTHQRHTHTVQKPIKQQPAQASAQWQMVLIHVGIFEIRHSTTVALELRSTSTLMQQMAVLTGLSKKARISDTGFS